MTGLNAGAGPQDGVKAVPSLLAVKFIHEAQGLNALMNSYKFPETVSRDDAAKFTGLIEDCRGVFAGPTSPRVGFVFDETGNFVMCGDALYTLDDLVKHGRISPCDVQILGYIAKYLARCVAVAP